MDDQPTPAQVEAVLKKARSAKSPPQDYDLLPVYKFVLPPRPDQPISNSTSLEASSSSHSNGRIDHFYCAKNPSDLHREGATYLIFLFAFRRDGMPKRFLDELERILKGCTSCARAFGGARRKFKRIYLSQFPPESARNFFAAVDRWQAALILSWLAALSTSSDTQASSAITKPTLFSLPAPALQLLFSEPNLISDASVSKELDDAIARTGTASVHPNITSSGLSPMLVRLLGSPSKERRTWASSQIQSCSRRPVTFEEWCTSSLGDEVKALYADAGDVKMTDRLAGVEVLLQSGCLSVDVIKKGIIEGIVELDGHSRPENGLISTLSHLLGGQSDHYPVILNCFALLLASSPSPILWSFDSSTELPHTLFSEIKDNHSFQDMITDFYGVRFPAAPLSPPPESADSFFRKGKGKETDIETPLSWIKHFLRSLIPVLTDQKNKATESPFPQALAKVMNYCFAEMQHERLSVEIKAAAARCGFEALTDIRKRIPENDSLSQLAFSDTLAVHAKFITTVGLQSKDRPGVPWGLARLSAQLLLEQCFSADGRDIVESLLGLAHIAFTERRRLRRAKSGRDAPTPQPVTRLHKATVQRQLWQMAYENVGMSDVNGVAIFIKSVATFGHVEILDRHNAWKHDKLDAVIKEEDWVAAIRAINHGLKDTREGFARALESMAMQPDTSITRSLFDIPGVTRSAIILLLSPVEELHEPIISLVQQAFVDADDRMECFRILLREYPNQAMDGLQTFLSSFIQTADKTPDSCSLAKWLVRCFTDVLDVLCNPSASEPLLHVESFLETRTNGTSMSKRVSELWQLMTESLAVIFDRTKEWAPLYENEAMVDWMRDALIFGRGMAEHIRVFEAASLGQSGSRFSVDAAESPMKITHVGKRLVEKLEKVLKHLVSWLRLTDIETLHQTFELIKTIVGRIAKNNPNLADAHDLEVTLQDIDKFSRRAGSTYKTRLSDDYLSELAGMLDPFNLALADDEVQFVREDKSSEASASASTSTSKRAEGSFKPLPPPVPVSSKRNAFEEMMKSAGGKLSTKSSSPSSSGMRVVKKPENLSLGTSSSKDKQKSKPVEVIDIEDEDFDDGWLEAFTGNDLEILEKRAKVTTGMPPTARPPKPALPLRHQPSAAAQKLHINVVPKKAPPPPRPTGGQFKSKFMQEMRREHRMDQAKRPPLPTGIGGVVRNLPAASALGTGLGAYTGPPREIKPMEDSGSSASESSDEDNKGIKALVNKQKSPAKRPLEPARRIQVMPTAVDHALKQREDRRLAQQRTKQRLRPDLTPLFRYILSWNPDHNGSTPPHHAKFLAECSRLGKVPTTFNGAKQYELIMLPLFLQELWSQSQQERGYEAPVKVEVSTRAYEDDFLDIDLIIPEVPAFGWYINETDIVVLRQPGQATRPLLAKVQVFKRKPVGSAVKLRILNVMDQREIAAKSKWTMTKHFSLSTAVREYGALRGLPYYEPELLSDILAGRATRMPHLTTGAVESAMEAYAVNEPQAKAILGAMSIKGFALIQGPPGTGKTKTISGLVGKFLSERSTPIPIGGQKAVKPKLLVCAPSNAAIDEVCKRLMNGVPSAKGNRLTPNIVRIGVEKSVNVSVKEVALDSLVEAAVAVNSANGVGTEYSRIQAEQAELKDKIGEIMAKIQATKDHDDKRRKLETEQHALMAQKVALGKQASRARDAVKDASRHLDGARRAARDAILGDADIICATLSGAGHESLAPFTFETVIIDEAAQAIEMSCLIPLKYGCRRCIMVGDPKQLPPTVISEQVAQYQYNESLFVRIAKRDEANMHLLSIQYRMHPFISELPSKVFYHGQLKDGPGMAAQTAAVWHQRNTYGPYRFFNVDGIEEKRGTSTYNPTEAAVAVDLYRGLLRDFGGKVNLALRIGIITMYKEQMNELKRQFIRGFGEEILQTIDFNTVDGFQGQEKDITILSTVRSGPALRTIGFLRDERRMNVALTRAKSSLFVIGNAPTLERSDEKWKIIVGDARDRGFLIDYNREATFAPGPIDEPEALIKAKVKKDKSKVKLKSEMETSSSTRVPVVGKAEPTTNKIEKKPEVKPTKNLADPTRIGSKDEKKPNDRVDSKEKPKPVVPAKRPSGIDEPPTSEFKRPHLSNSDPPKPKLPGISGGMTNGGLPRPSLPGPKNPARPPPPNGLPPPSAPGNRPPPPTGRPPVVPPPPPPTRPAEDTLFIKKKKKPKGSGVPPPPAGPSGPSVRDRFR